MTLRQISLLINLFIFLSGISLLAWVDWRIALGVMQIVVAYRFSIERFLAERACYEC